MAGLDPAIQGKNFRSLQFWVPAIENAAVPASRLRFAQALRRWLSFS
jgi:hypothetical protein